MDKNTHVKESPPKGDGYSLAEIEHDLEAIARAIKHGFEETTTKWELLQLRNDLRLMKRALGVEE